MNGTYRKTLVRTSLLHLVENGDVQEDLSSGSSSSGMRPKSRSAMGDRIFESYLTDAPSFPRLVFDYDAWRAFALFWFVLPQTKKQTNKKTKSKLKINKPKQTDPCSECFLEISITTFSKDLFPRRFKRVGNSTKQEHGACCITVDQWS